MKLHRITIEILKSLAIIIASALLIYFLYKIQSIVVYIAVSAVLSLIGIPIIRFFKRYLKFPNTLAVITTMLFYILILGGIISMFIPLVLKQSENLSLLNTEKFQNTIQVLINQLNDYFSQHNINILNELKSLNLLNNVSAIPNLLNAIISAIGSISIGLFSIIFITFFFMKDTHILENSIYIMVNDKSKSKLKTAITSIKNLLSRYFIGLVFQISILFIIYTVILLTFGVENAIVIALLCALLNLIPYVGPLIGGFLMLFLTMSNNLHLDFQTQILPTTIYVMIGYVFAQLIDNFLSQPIIFSNSVKSHPLEIFLVISIGGILFGISGMIVAVPTYTAIKVILKAFLAENKVVKSLTKNL